MGRVSFHSKRTFQVLFLFQVTIVTIVFAFNFKSFHRVSINGDQVSILLLNKLTLATTLNSLSASKLDVIRLLKSFYLKNISGLSLAYLKIPKSSVGKVDSYKSAGNPRSSYSSAGNASVASYGNYNSHTYNTPISQPFNENSVFKLINPIGSPLKKALAGNVFLFDLIGNIFNIYSSTISVESSKTMSLVYLDKEFFSYSTPNMLSNINR